MINFFVLNVKHPDHYSRTKSIAEQEVLRANGLSLQGREFLFCPFVNISSSSSSYSSCKKFWLFWLCQNTELGTLLCAALSFDTRIKFLLGHIGFLCHIKGHLRSSLLV